MTEITEQQRNENLSDFFENLEEVLELIENYKLIKVDLEKETLTLFEITEMKQQIPLCIIELKKEENLIGENY